MQSFQKSLTFSSRSRTVIVCCAVEDGIVNGHFDGVGLLGDASLERSVDMLELC